MSAFGNSSEWPLVPLKDIAPLKRGYDLPVSRREEGNIPIYAANGKNGTHSEAKIVGPGVITGRSGTIGKVHYSEGDYWPLNTSLYVTNFRGNDPRWVFYMLKAFRLERFSEGAGVPTLNRNLIHDELIPLPPLAEQKRIAAILDKADAIRRKRQQAIQLADDFLRAVFLDMFGDPVTNPKGWQVVMLSDVVFFQEGPGVRNWQFKDSGIKLLNVKNIVNGNLVLGNSDKYLSKDEVFTKYPHFLAEPDDLVMASSGATWGKSAWVDDSHLPLCMNTSTIRFHPLDTSILDRHYMHGFLKSSSFRQQIEKMITGSAQPNFGPTHLKQVKIMLPPSKEQSRYSNILTSLYETMSKMSAEVSGDLFASLSQKAFRGEL